MNFKHNPFRRRGREPAPPRDSGPEWQPRAPSEQRRAQGESHPATVKTKENVQNRNKQANYNNRNGSEIIKI